MNGPLYAEGGMDLELFKVGIVSAVHVEIDTVIQNACGSRSCGHRLGASLRHGGRSLSGHMLMHGCAILSDLETAKLEEPHELLQLACLCGELFCCGGQFLGCGCVLLNNLVQFLNGIVDFLRAGILLYAGRRNLLHQISCSADVRHHLGQHCTGLIRLSKGSG